MLQIMSINFNTINELYVIHVALTTIVSWKCFQN